MNDYKPIFENPIGWTSLEQAKKLAAAGLVPNTADMYYYAVQKFDGNEYVNTGEWQLATRMADGEEHFKYLIDTFGTDEFDSFVPCWSVGRLIEYMPKEIEHITKHFVKDPIMMYESITFSLTYGSTNRGHYAGYHHPICEGYGYECVFVDEKDSLVSAIVDVLLWLLNNRKIETTLK